LVVLLQLLSTAYSKLQVSVQGQNMYTKAQEASNLWEPDNKGQVQQNGASTVLLWPRLNMSQVPGFQNANYLHCGINISGVLSLYLCVKMFEINVIWF
jgi:hypothetical protein